MEIIRKYNVVNDFQRSLETFKYLPKSLENSSAQKLTRYINRKFLVE